MLTDRSVAAFGIGGMIYSGLEVGQYFDLKSTPECTDVLLVISPVSRMLFIFIQMYFIFLNSRVSDWPIWLSEMFIIICDFEKYSEIFIIMI